MAINKMYESMIHVPEVLEDAASRVDIFIMEEKYTPKIHQAKSALYIKCNTGVSVIN